MVMVVIEKWFMINAFSSQYVVCLSPTCKSVRMRSYYTVCTRHYIIAR